MAKLPERGLTNELPTNVRAMMDALNAQHGFRAHDRVLRLTVMGGTQVMPGGETEGGGDVILSDGAHREFTVYEPKELRLENFVDVLSKKATQRNTVEVYVQFNHPGVSRAFLNEWMKVVQVEVRAGRRASLRGIFVRLFDQFGADLWEGRMH